MRTRSRGLQGWMSRVAAYRQPSNPDTPPFTRLRSCWSFLLFSEPVQLIPTSRPPHVLFLICQEHSALSSLQGWLLLIGQPPAQSDPLKFNASLTIKSLSILPLFYVLPNTYHPLELYTPLLVYFFTYGTPHSTLRPEMLGLCPVTVAPTSGAPNKYLFI